MPLAFQSAICALTEVFDQRNPYTGVPPTSLNSRHNTDEDSHAKEVHENVSGGYRDLVYKVACKHGVHKCRSTTPMVGVIHRVRGIRIKNRKEVRGIRVNKYKKRVRKRVIIRSFRWRNSS